MKTLLLVLLAGAVSASAVGRSRRVKRIVGGTEAEKPFDPAQIPSLPQVYQPLDEPKPTAAATASPTPSSSKPSGGGVTATGIKKGGMEAFLGLRYALSPAGKNRFKRPRQAILSGHVDARRYGSPCPQLHPMTQEVLGEEDCLFLNVFKPIDCKENCKLPVLLWIHGGDSFTTGSGAQYDPTTMVTEKKVIVVTCNYRLGILGFLSSRGDNFPGNAALYDILSALRWTKKYIHHFGGDPTKITAAGQGVGASLANHLALNKDSSALLQGIIAMSGSSISPFSVDKNETDTYNQVATESESRCDQFKELDKYQDCLSELPLEQLLKGVYRTSENKKESGSLMDGLVGLKGPGPSEEGYNDDRFLTHFIQGPTMPALQKTKLTRAISLLIGVVKEETGGAIKGPYFDSLKKTPFIGENLNDGIFKEIYEANKGLFPGKKPDSQLLKLFSDANFITAITQLAGSALSKIQQLVQHTTNAFFNLPAVLTAQIWSKKSKNTYLYSFEHIGDHSSAGFFLQGFQLAGLKKSNKAPQHGDDLRYLFRPQTIFGDPIEDEMEGNDCEVSKYMMNMFSSFMRNGKPVIKEGVPWAPYSKDRNNFMVIDINPHESEHFHECQLGLWKGDANVLKSTYCSFDNALASALETLMPGQTHLTDQVHSTLSKVTSPLGSLGGLVDKTQSSLTSPMASLVNPMKAPSQPSTDPLTSLFKPKPQLNPFGLFG